MYAKLATIWCCHHGQTIGQIFRYGIAHGFLTHNPASNLKPSDIILSRRTVNYARIDVKLLPELLPKIDAYQGAPVTRLALSPRKRV